MRYVDMQSAYRQLGVSEDSAPSIIKARYRKLVLELHPDRNGGGDDARLKIITDAYHTLRDAVVHGSSAAKQRTAQDTRNAQRQRSSRQGSKMRDTKSPEEDWSRFTSEFEKDATFWKEYERNFWQDYERRRDAQQRSTEDTGRKQQAKSPRPDAPPTSGFSRTGPAPRHDVRIDESLCIGCCSCETIAPRTFQIDKSANVNPKSRVIDPRGDGVETMMDAAQTCPTKAITVQDTLRRVRMYPF